jgi:hypothetical protein
MLDMLQIHSEVENIKHKEMEKEMKKNAKG